MNDRRRTKRAGARFHPLTYSYVHSRIAPLNDQQALNYVGQYLLGMPKSY